MPLTLRAPRPPKSPNYEIRGTYLGIAIERSARTADKKLAIKVKKQIEREIEVGLLTPKSAVTFLEAAVSYMKAGGERSFLGPIIDYNGAYAIRDKAAETIVQEDLNHRRRALSRQHGGEPQSCGLYTDHRGAAPRRHRAPLQAAEGL